jgi:hydrogenase maturation factor HypE
MENKVVFVDGLNIFTPSENAPEWVKADMVINPTNLIKWLEKNDQYLKEGKRGLELRLQIKQSAQGKLYAAVDTYQPKLKEEVTSKQTPVAEESDLPF